MAGRKQTVVEELNRRIACWQEEWRVLAINIKKICDFAEEKAGRYVQSCVRLFEGGVQLCVTATDADRGRSKRKRGERTVEL